MLILTVVRVDPAPFNDTSNKKNVMLFTSLGTAIVRQTNNWEYVPQPIPTTRSFKKKQFYSALAAITTSFHGATPLPLYLHLYHLYPLYFTTPFTAIYINPLSSSFFLPYGHCLGFEVHRREDEHVEGRLATVRHGLHHLLREIAAQHRAGQH
jgi:hypothetical protein